MQSALWNLPPKRVRMSGYQQGSYAVRNGQAVEAAIFGFLDHLGFRVDHQYNPGWTGIRGNDIHIDVYLHPCAEFPEGLAIESRWQQSEGTVDQKLLHTATELSEFYRCPAILLVTGGAANTSVIDFVRSRLEGQGQLVAVMDSIDGFVAWVLKRVL